MKYNVPLRCFHVGSIVFIETVAWATVVAPDLQSLPNFEVVRELPLALIAHCFEDGRVVPIDFDVAMFIILGYSRVVPIVSLSCDFMFFASIFDSPYCLPYIDGFRVTWALYHVDTFFVFLWGMSFVFPT